jgi:hypothetical protein
MGTYLYKNRDFMRLDKCGDRLMDKAIFDKKNKKIT